MKRWFGLAAAVLMVSGCSMFGPKPQVVYHKPKVKSTTSKVLVMPVTNFAGEKSEAAADIQEAVDAGWAQVYRSKAIPAGPNVEELNKSQGEGYQKILASMKKPTKAAKLKNDPVLGEYLKKVAETAGDYNFAFAVIEGEKSDFDAGKSVQLWLGVFDTKAFTWMWITKTVQSRSIFGGWEGSSALLVATSFDKAGEVNSSKTNMAARKPASR